MIFLVAEIERHRDTRHRTTLQAWINTQDPGQARLTAETRLLDEGWIIDTIIECSETRRDDYFPPCTSLDAYLEAEQTGIFLKYG